MNIEVFCKDCEDPNEYCEKCFRESHKMQWKRNHQLERIEQWESQEQQIDYLQQSIQQS